jgi:hypothetical protein
MHTKIIFGIFSLLIIGVGLVYYTSPTLREELSGYFVDLYYVAPKDGGVAHQKTVEQTFTGTTLAVGDVGSKEPRSITYTLHYPASITIKHLNNESSELSLSPSSEAILLNVFYAPEATSLASAWQTYFTNTLKNFDKSSTSQLTEKPLINVSGNETQGYTFAGKDFIITHFVEHKEWYFIFDIRTTPQGKALLPVAETLSVTGAK